MRKLLVLTLTFALSFSTTLYAQDKFQFRDKNNVQFAEVDDSDNLTGLNLEGSEIISGTIGTAPLDRDYIEESELASLGDLNTQISATVADGPHTSAGHSNGANCSAGSAPEGVDGSGAVENCTDYETDSEASSHEGNASAHHTATVDTNANTICTGTGNYLDGEGNCDALVTDTGAPHGNGANCSAGSAPLGTDAAGAVEGCFDVETDAEASSHEGNASAHHTATVDTNANTICSGTGNYLDGEGNCDALVTAAPEFEGRETTASICSSTPGQAGNWKISSNDFDFYTSTGAGLGDWRNARTGIGACSP